MAQQPPSGPRLSHCRGFTITLKTHHTRPDSSGRVISPSQRPLPDNTQHSQDTDIHSHGGIRTRNPARPTPADPPLGPHGHWDQLTVGFWLRNCTRYKLTVWQHFVWIFFVAEARQTWNLASFVTPDTTLSRKRYGILYSPVLPVPVAARSKAWVCGCWLAGIADSNLAVGMDVCLLWMLCFVR